jgi:hypothetical protein
MFCTMLSLSRALQLGSKALKRAGGEEEKSLLSLPCRPLLLLLLALPCPLLLSRAP